MVHIIIFPMIPFLVGLICIILITLQIDLDLIKPTMRAAVEQQLNMIAEGKVNFEAVLSHSLDIFKRKFKYFVVNINGMDELFEVSFSPLAASGRPLSRYAHLQSLLFTNQ